MTNELHSLLTEAMRRDSIGVGYTYSRNDREVVKLRSSRHAFPEDVLNMIQNEGFRIEAISAVILDHANDEVLEIDSPDGFEPVPEVVLGDRE